MNTKVYDLLGIGIGPFNLGLSALLQDHPEMDSIFLEQKKYFDWHPGLLLPWARMQVPFYADLVTGANPCSKYSYMNYLHTTQKMFAFAVQENNFPLRIEYNQYCQWVAEHLSNLLFDHCVENINYDKRSKTYVVGAIHPSCDNPVVFHTKRLVIGTGTVPHIPDAAKNLGHRNIIHLAEYLYHRDKLIAEGDISIIGSGQSAAEIFYDLLQHHTLINKLNWFTRSSHIFPMDYSRFALEMSSPAYIDYFFNLPEKEKEKLLTSQQHLYKGVNQELIKAIHDQLILHKATQIKLEPTIQTCMELKNIKMENGLELIFDHLTTKKSVALKTRAVILATGYEHVIPSFLKNVRDKINWTVKNNYKVNRNYSVNDDQTIFVQNADLHSHGFNSADLGLGPYRNSIILNTIFGKQYFQTEPHSTFQDFR